MRLTSKTAIVTGAGSGIGRAIALCFVNEGARVVVHSRSADHADETAKLIANASGSDPDTVTGPIEEATTSRALAERIDSLDILVNSAGIDNFEPVDQVSIATWRRVVAVNLEGVFHTCHALLPKLSRAQGAIVNIASASALIGSQGMAAYSASKGGVVSLTRQMAVDYAADGVRVNAICPGSIDTPMLRAGFESRANPAEAESECVRRHPLGRLGTPDDVALGAVYLASDEASFVTGATLVIDGGLTIGQGGT